MQITEKVRESMTSLLISDSPISKREQTNGKYADMQIIEKARKRRN
jgi:hypothetical protein